MLIIGVTGGSGSGKSKLCESLAKLGVYVIDADIVSRKILERGSPALDEVVNSFGKAILHPNGSLNRKKLGNIVFSNPNKLDLLNKITHKHIIASIMYELRKKNPEVAAIDAAVLFESGMDKMCDFIVTVSADLELRVKRIILRDEIDEKSARLRINAQNGDEFYMSKSNYVVENKENLDMDMVALEILKKARGDRVI